ncbi:MAG: GFA family protein [Pseudomonadota bacterium]
MTVRGSCHCGGVTFEIEGDLPPAIACHCSMCRKWTGHFEVSTEIDRSQLRISRAEDLRWYQSSTKVRRGFCGTCGASLFFDPPHVHWIAVAMGALETPTRTTIEKHIFVADKGDYYEIADGLPQESAPPE